MGNCYSPRTDSSPQIINDIDIIIQTIRKNIITDYQFTFTPSNLHNILQLYSKVFQQKGNYQQTLLYQQLKSHISDQTQIDILTWVQTKRSRKYSYVIFPQSKMNTSFKYISICPTTDDLRMSRITHKYSQFMKQTALLTHILIDKSNYFIQQVNIDGPFNTTKKYLFRHKHNSQPKPTPWIVQKTKDLRYVWRGDIDIDQYNVQILLKFILSKRNQNDQCPSILINAGSHGANFGRNCYSTGNFQLTQIKIYQQIIDLIYRLVQSNQLKLTKENIRTKIYIHKLSSSIPCTYPLFADHIIDVQCSGAFQKVSAQHLVPRGAKHDQVDLLFLDSHQQKSRINKIAQFQIKNTQAISNKNQKLEKNLDFDQTLNFQLYRDNQEKKMKLIVQILNEDKYKEWVKNLQKINDGESQQLFLVPESYNFQNVGLCGNNGQAEIVYPNYQFKLNSQIKNRLSLNKYFDETQIWYILYILVKGGNKFQQLKEKIGDIHVNNILINQNGNIVIVSKFSIPYELTNLERYIKDRDAKVFLAPQEMKQDIKSMAYNQQINKCLAQVFSMGLCVLSAGTLQNCNNVYDRNPLRINPQKLSSLIEKFSKRYSNYLTQTLKSMLEINPLKRAHSSIIYKNLKKHQEKILDLQQFTPN